MKFLRNIHTGFEYPVTDVLMSNPDFVLVDDSAPAQVETVAQEPAKKRARKTKVEAVAQVEEITSDDVQPANQ